MEKSKLHIKNKKSELAAFIADFYCNVTHIGEVPLLLSLDFQRKRLLYSERYNTVSYEVNF